MAKGRYGNCIGDVTGRQKVDGGYARGTVCGMRVRGRERRTA